MLTITGLRKNREGLPVLDGIDLRIGDGEIVALLGPSGCGKTTLLNIIAGFVPADAGRVDSGNDRIGYLFQEDRLLPWLTVEENIRIVGASADRGEVEELIALVGLAGFGRYYPDSLSGGMRQRAALARAYHFRCDLLLMDEPFKSLDHSLRREMLASFMTIWRQRRNAVLLVTHEVDEALAAAGRIVVLSQRPTRVKEVFLPGATETTRDEFTDDLSEMRRDILAALS